MFIQQHVYCRPLILCAAKPDLSFLDLDYEFDCYLSDYRQYIYHYKRGAFIALTAVPLSVYSRLSQALFRATPLNLIGYGAAETSLIKTMKSSLWDTYHDASSLESAIYTPQAPLSAQLYEFLGLDYSQPVIR